MTGDEVKRSIVIASVLVIALASAALGFYFIKSNSGNETITATISIDFGNETIWKYCNITVDGENATVFDFLLAAAKNGSFDVKYTYYGQYDSYLVDSIAGVVNGRDNKYWQYWINGVYGMVGADKQPVENGDIIEWKFTEFS